MCRIDLLKDVLNQVLMSSRMDKIPLLDFLNQVLNQMSSKMDRIPVTITEINGRTTYVGIHTSSEDVSCWSKL